MKPDKVTYQDAGVYRAVFAFIYDVLGDKKTISITTVASTVYSVSQGTGTRTKKYGQVNLRNVKLEYNIPTEAITFS